MGPVKAFLNSQPARPAFLISTAAENPLPTDMPVGLLSSPVDLPNSTGCRFCRHLCSACQKNAQESITRGRWGGRLHISDLPGVQEGPGNWPQSSGSETGPGGGHLLQKAILQFPTPQSSLVPLSEKEMSLALELQLS